MKPSRNYNLGMRATALVDDATRAAWAVSLRGARESRGISQFDLAELVGCTRGAVSAWERGINTPSPAARKALAKALKRPVSRLFPETVAA